MRRLPKPVFDYLDGGAEAEVTLRENCRAFETVTFRPRNAVAVPHCDMRTHILGAELSFPAILAPVGYSRLMHADGECAAAREPAKSRAPRFVSPLFPDIHLKTVSAATPGPIWYQLYLVGGRAAAEAALERAAHCRIFGSGRHRSTQARRECASATSATARRSS